MGEFVDKVKGNVNEAIGKAKQGLAGDDNHELKAEGAAQEAKGETQKAAGSVKGALGDNV